MACVDRRASIPDDGSGAGDAGDIDLEITFDYNSANISAKAQPAVEALGKALSNADLKGAIFIVAGHTDAAGGVSYN